MSILEGIFRLVVSLTLAGSLGTLLVLGAATASCLWFSGVTLVISLFSARFNDRILRAINIVCGSVILAYGLRLILQFIRSI